MRTIQSRAVVLIVLLGFSPACSRPSREAATPEPAPAASAALAESSRALLALLPADGEVPGWVRKRDVRFYGTGNLWDFVDGGAEAYIRCGFEEVVTSEYSNPAVSSGILLDVFRMSDAAGALGIYSQERSPNHEAVSIGAEGLVGANALTFWSNAYYVKLTAFQENAEIKPAMIRLAQSVSRKLGTPGPRPTSSSHRECGTLAGLR
jgi:hypothetical protein